MKAHKAIELIEILIAKRQCQFIDVKQVISPDDLDALLSNEEFNEASYAQVREHFLGLGE